VSVAASAAQCRGQDTIACCVRAQGRAQACDELASREYPSFVRCLSGRRPASNDGRSNQDSLSAESTFFLWGSTEKSAEQDADVVVVAVHLMNFRQSVIPGRNSEGKSGRIGQ